MSDFAKAQLLKYGWTEGKGLGKHENGISEALRPKLKFDTAGIGHKESNFEWWNSIYNKAASNIVLDKKADQVSISIADKNAFNISTKKDAPQKEYSLYNGKFLKTSTLQDGNMIKDESCQNVAEETSNDPFVGMTDDELFKVCGGRTAHKGARHGLTLNGKLNRIAEQEKKLLANILSTSCTDSKQCNQRKQKKSKKRKASAETQDCTLLLGDANIGDDLIIPSIRANDDYKPSKKTAKKVKRKIHDLTQQLTKSCMIQDDSVGGDEENSTQDTSEDNTRQKKSKKKRKSKRKRDQEPKGNNDSDTSVPFQLDDDDPMEPSTKKKKRKVDLSAPTLEEITGSSDCVQDKNSHKTVKNKKKSEKKKTYHFCTVTDAQKLNYRINKKKCKKLHRKEKKEAEKTCKKSSLSI